MNVFSRPGPGCTKGWLRFEKKKKKVLKIFKGGCLLHQDQGGKEANPCCSKPIN